MGTTNPGILFKKFDGLNILDDIADSRGEYPIVG
jgi:hypothetical protein